jgi:hypothetical protein
VINKVDRAPHIGAGRRDSPKMRGERPSLPVSPRRRVGVDPVIARVRAQLASRATSF